MARKKTIPSPSAHPSAPAPALTVKFRRLAGLAVGLCLLLLLVVGGALLRQEDGALTAAQKRLFASAQVTDVLYDDAQSQDWTEGLRLGTQLVELEIRSGPYKGTVLEAYNYLSAYANVDCSVGTRVIVRLDLDDAGEPYVITLVPPVGTSPGPHCQVPPFGRPGGGTVPAAPAGGGRGASPPGRRCPHRRTEAAFRLCPGHRCAL